MKFNLLFEDGEPVQCLDCHSNKVIKQGKMYRKFNIKQRYLCKACNKTFIFDDGFKRCKTPKHIILFALSRIKTYSSRQLSRLIKSKFKYPVTHTSISHWFVVFGYRKQVRYMHREERIMLLKRNLKRYKNQIVKAHVIRIAGNYKDTTHLKTSIAVSNKLVSPLVNGFYFVGDIQQITNNPKHAKMVLDAYKKSRLK